MSDDWWRDHEEATDERLAATYGRRRVRRQVRTASGRVLDHAVLSRFGGVSRIVESKAKRRLSHADVNQLLDYHEDEYIETGNDPKLEFSVDEETRISGPVMDRLIENDIALSFPDDDVVGDGAVLGFVGLTAAASAAHVFRHPDGRPNVPAGVGCGLMAAFITAVLLD